MIHLLATGGTIAMQRSTAAGGNVPALDPAGLLALVGDLGAAGAIRVEDWEPLPAVHRGPSGLWALRQRVAALVTGPEAPEGIVITHGTDTLEETAYLLARTLPPTVPVVLTGAMRTSSDPEWDGPRNLRDAIRVAFHPESRGRGTMVVFSGRILDGRDVAKVHSFAPDAFDSPHSEPLGRVAEGEVRFVRPHFDGVVLEAFGRGNAPPGILPAVRRWLAEAKPVILATRCPYGEVGGEYAFEGGGGQLLRLGVRPAGPRSAALARLELVLCLATGSSYGGTPQ